MQYWLDIALWIATSLVFAAFFMKEILLLRVVAVASNLAFMVYAFGASNMPILILHAALLPLNLVRIKQHLKLLRSIKLAIEDDPHIEKLIPLMERKRHRSGTVLFRKGQKADAMYFLLNGEIELTEVGVTLGSGTIFGEIALFLNDKSRTATAVCTSDCEICELSEDRVKELAVTDGAFGLFLTRLIAERMNENVRNIGQDTNKLGVN